MSEVKSTVGDLASVVVDASKILSEHSTQPGSLRKYSLWAHTVNVTIYLSYPFPTFPKGTGEGREQRTPKVLENKFQ